MNSFLPISRLCFCLSFFTLVATFNVAAVTAQTSLDIFVGQKPAGTRKPENAAKSLFRGCATKSPRDFVANLLLGVCDGPVNSINKYAESLHTTKYNQGKKSYSVYEFPKPIEKESIRVIAKKTFDQKQYDSLSSQFVSTYTGKEFVCCLVQADSRDGNSYQTRIIVAKINDRWYGMPRCRSSRSFYRIADEMVFAVPSSIK